MPKNNTKVTYKIMFVGNCLKIEETIESIISNRQIIIEIKNIKYFGLIQVPTPQMSNDKKVQIKIATNSSKVK